MPGFWIYQGSEYASRSGKAREPEYWICQGYTGFLFFFHQGFFECVGVCLNMHE